MAIAQSKVTAQGQISVPSEIRRRLGIGPGSLLEWEESGGEIVVRRAARFDSKAIHAAVFPAGRTKRRTLEELKEGIRSRARSRYGRD